MYTISVIYGTRPEYLKLLPIIEQLNKLENINLSVVRIIQHEHLNEKDLVADINITIDTCEGSRLDIVGSQILLKLGSYINNQDYIIVQGDTATTFYSALCAFQNNIKVVHIEAGLRTYDITNPYPEEGYRQMISRIATFHFTPHNFNSELLLKECVSGKVLTVGNTILDLVKSYNFSITKTNDILITFHRRENIQYLELFIRELKICIDYFKDKKFIWFLHPNKVLQEQVKKCTSEYMCNITFIEPCSHKDFLKYLVSCYCVLTDSGGIQEEAAYLGKQVIVLRATTERDMIPFPYIQLVMPPYNNLIDAIKTIQPHNLDPCLVYGDGNTSKLITNYLISNELKTCINE